LPFALTYGVNAGLIFGFCYWLVPGLFWGLTSDQLDENARLTPNVGIWRSGRNSLIIALGSGIIGWLATTMIYGFSDAFSWGWQHGWVQGWDHGWRLALFVSKGLAPFIGLNIALLCGLLVGGQAYIQHYILRLLLWRAGS
jgi:hypothetical protein